MNILNNWLTEANSRHPANFVWNPGADGPRLAGFMPVPDSAVGVAITGARGGSTFE